MTLRLLLAGPALALGFAASWTAPALALDNSPADPHIAFQQCVAHGGEIHEWTSNGQHFIECCASNRCVVCQGDQCMGSTPQAQIQTTPPSRLGGVQTTPGVTLQPAN